MLAAMLWMAAASVVSGSVDPNQEMSAEHSPAQVPISSRILSDGMRRYSVTVTIDGEPIEAALDTGSVGLRVLRNRLGLPDVGSLDGEHQFEFAIGTILIGAVEKHTVSIGPLAGVMKIQVVSRISCATTAPNCPAISTSFDNFGLEGDGHPGEGYGAILGVGLGSQDLPNPLIGLRVSRWIVKLPRVSPGSDGSLSLSPSDSEVSRFVPLNMVDRIHHPLQFRACVSYPASSSLSPFCFPTTMDTGAPGIQVPVCSIVSSLPDARYAWVRFEDESGRDAAQVDFAANRRLQASRIISECISTSSERVIHLGVMPYLAFLVMYDGERGSILLAPSPPLGDGPFLLQGTVLPVRSN